ncbi:MAG: prolyl oligopeptidase family serine peptidase, partial [Muribaculaceae bacterium]|nr:prolyl oligopeptidase family serine peptidase [Muribaculaceae bacterium]
MKRKSTIIALMGLAIASCSKQNNNINYPEAPSDGTIDNYYGIEVNDPYRPLENDTAAETLAWVEAENAITQEYLSKIPFRGKIRDRIEQLNNYPKIGLPAKKADGKYYFFKNDGLKNQSVLYRSDTPDGDGEVFLDPNTLSDDGTVALTGVYQSHDGKYTAYTISRSGSDWTEIYIMDTATGKLLDDHIEWAKFTGAAWHGDGFYYSAYDRPEKGKEYSNANEYHKVYYHKIGTPQSSDKVIYENRNEPLHFHSVDITDDESTLIVMGGGAGNGNSLYIKDLTDPASKWITVEESQDNDISVIDARDGKLYIFTSADAPKYRLVTADIKTPERKNWQDLVQENNTAVLVDARFAGDKLILTYDKDASHHAYVYNQDGTKEREITLPGYGTLAFSTNPDDTETFYAFSSFTTPSQIMAYNAATGDSRLFRSTELPEFNPDDYVTEQVFYPSSDGTMIPMFITYKKGLKKNGKNPVYLYGYGGFNVTLNPGFSANRLFWLENGGIYAQANLRGGGEYGEDWHLAGTKLDKKNVFEDFIAAAEYMIDEGWTQKDLLAIEGGSNGGLLVGAVTNMRPDLFKVAIPRVGVMDMMRYHLFTIGWNWAHD